MRKQSYIEFSDMRVFWDKKTDTIRITSGDPDLASKGWSLTLNRASKDEKVLREALIESGIIPPASEQPRHPQTILTGEPGMGRYEGPHISYGREGGTLMNDSVEIAKSEQVTTTQGWVGPYLGATAPQDQTPVFFSAHDQHQRRTPYRIGHTTRSTNTPVSYDMHGDILENFPPVCLIAGAPGSGKSIATAQLIYRMVTEADALVVHVNPGGDNALLGRLPNTELFNLVDYPGLLNPYLIAQDPAERREMLVELIMGLIANPGYLRATLRTHVIEAIDYVDARRDTSLEALLRALTRDGAEHANAFSELHQIMELPFANVIFGKPVGRRLNLGPRLNMITGNFQLPSDSLPRKSYGQADRLGEQIMQLLTYHLMHLLRDEPKQARKALVIDPADILTASSTGQRLAWQLARTGRSLNTALVLAQNSAAAFNSGTLSNMLGGKLLFRTHQPEDIQQALGAFGLTSNNFNQKMVRNLRNGECLFQHGGMGEAVTVQIELDPKLARWLETD